MKTRIVLSFLLSFSFYLLSSQVPQGFNYQAIARDGTNPITTPIDVRITIQSESGGGTAFWIEEHSSVIPNASGLFSLVIGNGVHQTGSAVDKFSEINWANGIKYIKTEINKDGAGYVTMGTSQLLSVPYSMVAGNVNDTLSKLVVTADQDVDTTALFIVRNNDGQTIFAVYNAGVRIYVDNGTKGKKGGFAIGGFDKAKDGVNQDLFIVDRDSVRVYLDTLSAKVKKGGFAIGGFGNAKKGSGEEYLHITRDSTRVYVNNGPEKVKKGGFAIGGFGGAKSEIYNFLDLTPENYFIGHKSGMSNTTGIYNSFLGYEAGKSNTDGNYNTFIGHESGSSNTNGWANLFIGDSAGFKNDSGFANVFLGPWAGQENKTGYYNISLGYGAGAYSTEGWQNTNIGASAGYRTTSGNRNIFLGTCAGRDNTEGLMNVFVGNFAGLNCTTGSNNVYIGAYTGRLDTLGSNNVFIGCNAGRNEIYSDRLYIANSATTRPLIFGEFLDSRLVIAGNDTNNIHDRTFFVNGTAGGLSEWESLSDRKFKHDIVTIPDALQKVLNLRGVNFLWNDPKAGMAGLQMGFIGQEAAEVIPEVVSIKDDHYAMQYAPITALLVEGMKEQQEQIDSQQKEIEQLKALINSIVANQAIK